MIPTNLLSPCLNIGVVHHVRVVADVRAAAVVVRALDAPRQAQVHHDVIALAGRLRQPAAPAAVHLQLPHGRSHPWDVHPQGRPLQRAGFQGTYTDIN